MNNEAASRAAAVEAAHRAFTQLKEHWSSVNVVCHTVDIRGTVVSVELESDDGEDD